MLLYMLYCQGLWSLDNPSEQTTAGVIQDAIQNPDRYVLKPQREGGGNNLYGQDLVTALQEGLAAGGGGLAAYILMQRIVPPPQRTVFVRNGAWAEDESLSELGIFGTFLRVGDKVGGNKHRFHVCSLLWTMPAATARTIQPHRSPVNAIWEPTIALKLPRGYKPAYCCMCVLCILQHLSMVCFLPLFCTCFCLMTCTTIQS